MPTELPPTIDPVAAARWARRAPETSPWLHEEVARRMAERLPVIRLPVRQWVDWSPVRGGAQGHELVRLQYPDAGHFRVLVGAQSSEDAIKKDAKTGWWTRWRGSRAAPSQAGPTPPPGAAQLLWANMLAHQSADPAALMADWHQALAVDGFLMFSCLGPDTVRELRELYVRLGWPPPAQAFTDMHDWGDQLVAAGFADPVMDMERLTLTFDTPARLLAELRELGRNLHPERFGGLRTPAWRRRLEAALDAQLRAPGGGPLTLSFEIVYGHALKPAPRHAVQAHTTLSLDEMRTQLRQRNRNLPSG